MLGKLNPYIANDLGNPTVKIPHLPQVRIGREIGDIWAWRSRDRNDHGHTAIYVGNYIVIYAGIDKVKANTTYFTTLGLKGDEDPIIRRYTPRNGLKLFHIALLH
ncbi:MAG TPA: hypothetical protein PK014_09215 [Thermoanaerobaculia bacterium]|nr:hypothetical protein [Thermoanaerobaculia bacterium]HUM30365.1 hypothetical protein [Thermoanaerobaculia bacterium]HXK68624.1 hypothetical protein [Thermoanaerobaculia bacterium]